MKDKQRTIFYISTLVLLSALPALIGLWSLAGRGISFGLLAMLILIFALSQALIIAIWLSVSKMPLANSTDGKYKKLAEGLKDVVFKIKYPERTYEFINKAVEDVVGYKPEEFYQNPKIWEEIILPEWHDGLQNFRDKLDQGLEPDTIQYKIKARDGSIKWLSQRNSYIKDKAGNLTSIEGTLVDITRQKASNANTEEAYMRIQLLNERLTAQTKALNETAIVVRTDTSGVITYCNDNLLKVSKYGIAELIGNNYSMLKSNKHSDEFYAEMWRTVNEGGIWRGEICNKAKDGSLYWVDAVITSIKDREDKIKHFITIRFDITDRKEIEQKLQIQNENTTASLNYAKRIQEATLPDQSKFSKWLPESFTFFKPRDIVSGDFYWFEEKIGKKYIAAVDCTGHGVPGAFMSLLGSGIMDKLVNSEHILDIDRLAEFMHIEIRKLLHQDKSSNRDGMDMAICCIDQRKHLLEFVGVKNPLVYFQNGELHVIKGDKMPIGGESYGANRKYTKHIISIQEPTTIYLFTDGYMDQFGGKRGRKMMSKKFYSVLSEIHQMPFDQQKKYLEIQLSDWMGSERQVDDILVVGIKVS